MNKGKITRRDFIKASSLTATGLFLQSCSTYAHKSIAPGKELDILYYADTLDTLQPQYIHASNRAIGPINLIGSAPWLKGSTALASCKAKLTPIEKLLLGAGNVTEKVGGMAKLAAVLNFKRNSLDTAKTLVLENGQCWNGSGLASLTQGNSGAAFTEFVHPDVRVLSDEFYLWNKASLEHYQNLNTKDITTLATTLPSEVLQKNSVLQEYKIFTKQDVKVGVVSANNPHNMLAPQMLDKWFDQLQTTINYIASSVDLLIVLADIGNAPAFWLADNLDNVDLILSARGMEYWPELVTTRKTPLYFGIPNALGVSHLKFNSIEGKWLVQLDFIPADSEVLQDENTLANAQNLVNNLRAAHASYLDFELAKMPVDVWQGDTLYSPIDSLYKESLAKFYESVDLFLTLGFRYKVYIPQGEYMRREDIFRLTGSYKCATYVRRTSGKYLADILSNQANQLFGNLNLLDTSFNLPRLFGADWSYRYAARQPINLMADLPANANIAGFTILNNVSKEPFISQLLEDYLLSRPANWKLDLANDLTLTNAKGHPGWN